MANDWRELAERLSGSRSPTASSSKSTSSSGNSSSSGSSVTSGGGSSGWRTLADELSGSRKQTYADHSNKVAQRVITRAKDKEEEKKKRKWFEKGLFEDGYDFGDVTKTILGSTADVLENVGSGIIGMGEKAVDAMAYIAPYAASSQFYQNGGFNLETEKAHRQAVEQSKTELEKFIAKDLYDEQKVARAIISDPARKIGIDSETQSVFGEKSDALIQSGGQLLATAGLQAVGVPWFLTTGVTSFGGEAENAMNQGATYEQAGASAAISAGAEILSEKLSGGISFGGKTLDDALTKQLARGISNKLGRTAAKLGLDMAGEGTEEVFSQLASNLGSSLYKEEDITELLFNEEAMDGYLESFIGGAALGGVAGSYNAAKSSSKGVDYTSGLTQNEQKVVDKLYKDEIASREKEGKVTQKEKSEIYDRILNEMDKGYISTDTIEEVLGGEKYSQYKQTAEWEDSLQTEFDTLNKMKQGDMTGEQVDRREALREQLKNVKATSSQSQLRSQIRDEVMGLVKGDRLAESYNERARTGQKFEADVTKYDAKQQAVVQKAIDSGILNNSNRTHEFVDFVSKISADTGVLFDFSNTAKIREAGFAVEGQTVDGFITKDGITVNIDSPKSRQFVVGHEITHALEGTELYDALRKSVFDYAKMKNQYGVRMESIQKRYKEGTDYEAELTADLVGEYIFSDTDFINNLSTQNRNVFEKVFDEIKYLYKVATAGSKEARELEKVKRAFEKAYREGGKTHGETKYSLNIKHTDGTVEELADARGLTNEQAVGYLHKAKSGSLRGETYIPVRKDTPQVLIDTLAQVDENIENRSLVMQVRKAQQAMTAAKSGRRAGKYGSNVRGHALSAEQIVEIVNNLDNPSTVIYQTNRYDGNGEPLPNNVAVFVEYNDNGTEGVAVIEFDSSINPESIGMEFGDTSYHTVVTVFEPDVERNGLEFDYAEELLSNPDNYELKIERRQPTESATRANQPNTFNELPSFNNSIAQESENVNYSLSDSNGIIAPTETVAFYPKQIKEVANQKPTADKDIHRSLSKIGEQHTSDSLSALRLQTAEESPVVAPVAENATVQQKTQLTEENATLAPVTADDMSALFPNNAVPVQEELEQLIYERDQIYSALEVAVDRGTANEVGKLAEEYEALNARIKELESGETERTGSLTDADVPPEMETPYQPSDEDYEGTPETVDDPFEERDIGEVGKQSVKAYQYENPEVKPFFQEAALGMLYDVRNTTKGEKWYNDELYYATGGEQGFGGTKRHTTDDIAELKDVYGYTYEQIENGLNAIIEDDGKENNAVSKRIEFMLNDRLLDGYTDVDGRRYEPNQGYIQLLNEKQITEYSREAFDSLMANADQYAPFAEDIAPLKQATPDTIDAPIYDDKGQTAMFEPVAEEKKQTRKEYHQGIIDNIKSIFKGKGFDFDKVLKNAKNLSTWSTVDNTPQRVMEKALGYKEGGVLADITVNQVAQNETEGIKWLNSYVNQLKQISKQYGIKPGSKESAAAQMYAEGFYVNENNEIVRYGDPELIQDFGNGDVRRRIKSLARDPRIRKIYDDTLANINASRARNLYPEIPRLDNYFLHFRAMEDTFSTLGLPFNPNDIRAKDLPTDLNGVTADLKPGQPYFSSAMHRKGKRTSFDLLGGVERYLNSAKNQIYHIDDIQTLRALRNYIAETYGQATGLEDIDSLTDAEAEERIKQVYGSHLSTFAKFLNEEANVLAGKTALIDRGIEGIIGRRGITFLNTLNKQVGSNMVGYNVSSSLTNFLPVAQAFAKTNKFDFTKAFAQTVANKLSGGRFDSFAEDSPVVIRRKGEDRFYRTAWQKMADPGYALMGMVDDISTEIIARTKYNEFTRKGMDSQKAHFETDKWVSRLMGDRSLGQQPQLYNSKMLGLVTKFQLEVRNQLDAQFYDTIQETKVSNEHIKNGLARNAKTAAKVASVFTQLAVAQHLYGMAFESMAGYNPAFDIIEVLMTAFGFDDEEDSEDTLKDNLEQGFEALMEDLPYASIVTGGGRIPVSSALPIKEFFKGEDQYGNEKSRWETLGEVAPYYLMPAGYGQAKKTTQGLKMFSDDHPIAGSYTDAGNLRYDVEDTVGSRIKAGIFGQYASENAQKYFDQEQRTLNPEQTEIFASLKIPIEEYWEYRDNLYEFYDVRDKLKDAAYADGATDEDVLRYTYINNVYGDIYDLYDKQKELASGSSRGKTLEIRQLQKQMEQMLSESKFGVDSMKLAGAYAEVGGVRYNKDADSGRWYEIKPKNADGSDNWYYQKEQEVTKGLGISYEEYWNNREEYNFAYDKPGKYAIAQAVGGYDSYMVHYDALENWQSDNYIAADKDAKGNSISGSRKSKVLDYINGLDLDYGERLILYRTVYSSKADKRAYNMEIINYLNERDDISYGEMKSILEELDMEVDSKGNITW